PSPLAKLSPPKDKPTALAFATTDPPKHETPKHDEPKHERSRPAQAAVEQTRPEPKRSVVFAEAPKPQPIFVEAFSSSANADSSLVQRTLTISDMKDYVKRN